MAPPPGQLRIRRPWAAGAAALTAAHHGFELSNGIGLVLQPELGLVGSGLLWGAQIPTWLALTTRPVGRWDRLLAAWCGAALAGVLVHFLMWPLRRTRLGPPVLAEAEGLAAGGLRTSSISLYAWAAASAMASLRDVPPTRRHWALVGLATLPIQRASAARRCAWLGEEAATRPTWWNRAAATR